MPPLIHPTAIISSEAKLADDVRIGAYAVIDGPVTLDSGCSVDSHAHLIGPLNVGRENAFGSSCVIGGAPQHTAYKGESTAVEIGNGNTFREHTTVHRAMPLGVGPGSGVTRIGDAKDSDPARRYRARTRGESAWCSAATWWTPSQDRGCCV